MADPLTIFGGLMTLMGGMGGSKEKAPAPAPVQEREVAPKVDPAAETAAQKQRKAVVSNRAPASNNTSQTRSGVSIVGG